MNLFSTDKNSSDDYIREKRRLLGSETAKGGFSNELFICQKFNNWESDNDAKLWLKIMNYDLKQIKKIEAIQIPTRIGLYDLEKFNTSEEEYEKFCNFKKADAQIKLIIKIGEIIKLEYISIKKANSNADFNQIDKRSVDSYQSMWGFNSEIAHWLKLFTGELLPDESIHGETKDYRRLFLNEMPEKIQTLITKFFTDNKILIISDIIKGRGGLSAGWMLVTMLSDKTKENDFVLKDINTTMNFFGKGDVFITKRGSLNIGKITMQRKGGTPDPTKLQFKFPPCKLFEIK